MTSAMMNLKRLCVIAGAGAFMAVLATTANAAQCRSTFDEDGDPVVMCGALAYATDEDGEFGDVDLDEDAQDARDFAYDEDEGSLLVDLENCEPGKYWMMDLEDGVPLPCR
jgi:hypothetical protein